MIDPTPQPKPQTPAPIDPVWRRAAAFAARAHDGQTRRDGTTPYIAHAARVAMIVRDLFGCDDPDLIAAAYLHDTIEDTGADYDEILELVGPVGAALVVALTKDMRLPEPEREAAYDDQLARAHWHARLLKLADVYDNLLDCEPGARLIRVIDKAVRAADLARADADPIARVAVELVDALIAARSLESGSRQVDGQGAPG